MSPHAERARERVCVKKEEQAPTRVFPRWWEKIQLHKNNPLQLSRKNAIIWMMGR